MKGPPLRGAAMEDSGAQGGLRPQLGVCLPTQPRPGSTWPVNPSDNATETLTQKEGGVQPATVRQSGRGCGTWAGWVLVPQTSRGQRATGKVKLLGCQDTPTLGPLPPPCSPSSWLWLSDYLSLPAVPLGLFLDGSLSLGLSLSGPLSNLGPSVPSRPMPAACLVTIADSPAGLPTASIPGRVASPGALSAVA